MGYNAFLFSLLAVMVLHSCKEKPSETNIEDTTPPPPKIEVEVEITAQLGEGSFWDHQSKKLFWVDILGKKLYRYDPEQKSQDTFEMPSRIGTVVPQTDSTAVVALEDGIYVQNLNSGVLSLLSDVEATQTENRFNDGKCDPNGNLWVGSMHLAETEAVAQLYKVEPNGTTTSMLHNITISNGIVWTKDAKTMYYIDTPTMKIRAFDYDKITSLISNERVAITVADSLGFPDGMAIDAEDKLWVGMWNGNAVVRFDPLTGNILDRIPVPAHNVTSCAFGGPNLDELYITSASVDMTDEEKAKYPLAGSVFKVKPGVQGVPSSRFGINE